MRFVSRSEYHSLRESRFIEFIRKNIFFTPDEVKINFKKQFGENDRLQIKVMEYETIFFYTDSQGRKERYYIFALPSSF